MPASPPPVEIFYSYAQPDALLRDTLEKHLSILRHQGIISQWHAHHIVAGTNREQSIDTHLERASIILLLISADFLASDYCYSREMQRALERHQTSSACVIPILLRPVDWQNAPFAHLQPLPTNAVAITSWPNQDEAFADVATGIRQAIASLAASASRAALPSIWNVPYPRNPFFSGRDELLAQLRKQLQNDKASALSQPHAISGLGALARRSSPWNTPTAFIRITSLSYGHAPRVPKPLPAPISPSPPCSTSRKKTCKTRL